MAHSAQEKNPDSVIVTSEPQCEIHGWVLGNTYPTVEHEINCPDANGYEVYVYSPNRQRAVNLSSSEYKLVETKEPAPGEWFYPLQKKVEEVLNRGYSDWRCNFQDITENRVHENYTVISSTGEASLLHVIMFKVSNTISFYSFKNQ